jgi:hypothetical protein
MRLIDADVFLEYLIFSKHIDGLTCGEVKKAVEMSKVDILDKIIVEIEQVAEEESKFNIKGARGLKHALKIINKYKAEMEGKDGDSD